MMHVEAPPAGSHDPFPSPREYTISLPVFEGPLDLLLHLIEREELDITAISLVQITDQYLQYIEQMERVNADYLADFLVIAAQLIWIKSRALLPKPPAPPEEEEEDPGEQLGRARAKGTAFLRAGGIHPQVAGQY
jgi:segregation and condensation protein A